MVQQNNIDERCPKFRVRHLHLVCKQGNFINPFEIWYFKKFTSNYFVEGSRKICIRKLYEVHDCMELSAKHNYAFLYYQNGRWVLNHTSIRIFQKLADQLIHLNNWLELFIRICQVAIDYVTIICQVFILHVSHFQPILDFFVTFELRWNNFFSPDRLFSFFIKLFLHKLQLCLAFHFLKCFDHLVNAFLGSSFWGLIITEI